MTDTDPGSLDRLHDIAVPPPVSWWPPAPGWYALAALVLVLIAVLVWQLVAWRIRTRYRRAALAELNALDGNAPVAAVAELIKRTALAAFPRDSVASPTGGDWLRFLDASGGTTDFTLGVGRALGDAEYAPGPHPATPELLAIARHWIAHHRTDRPC